MAGIVVSAATPTPASVDAIGTNVSTVLAGATLVARKTVTFTGAANAGQAASAVPVFTCTGQVVIERIVGRVTTSLTAGGGASLILGVTGATSLFIGVTLCSALLTSAANWISTTPTAGGIALPAIATNMLINANIIITPATADTTAGVIDIYCIYRAMSSNGALA